ncbi:transcription factor SRM1-like [Brassica napus]|uniref:transcription factor SRM1-like n=1 Tax=Brassica napus TaxID=3708 RepID=UPI002078B7CA|nr:transcription factor SRM1-like [Brassica napus]
MAWWEQWGRDEEKMFEEALVLTENDPNRFETIASYLEMPLEVVKHHYDALVHDVERIESGPYGTIDYQDHADGLLSSETKHVEKDNKRGRPWTAKEHGDFLKGLDEFGRGDWKSVSRKYVKTRSARQVASHAQKYFQRQDMENHAKKRSSINDMTLVDVNDADDVPAPRSDSESTMDPAHFGQQTP